MAFQGEKSSSYSVVWLALTVCFCQVTAAGACAGLER